MIYKMESLNSLEYVHILLFNISMKPRVKVLEPMIF